jgi:glucosamine 6-phosphate synthetase-like amidotransferase/phosphosugar isomerase protein
MKNSKGSKKTYVILDSDCDEYRYADSLQDIEDHIDNMSSNFADLKSFSEFVKENVRVFEIGRKINIKVASKKITVS